MDPSTPNAFIDPSTIGGFAVASAGVFAFNAVVVRGILGSNRLIWPFLMCLAISYGLAENAKILDTFLGWLIALLNACILCTSVMGVNEGVLNALTPKPTGGSGQQAKRPEEGKYLMSFFRRT
jgi:hypothetical protein